MTTAIYLRQSLDKAGDELGISRQRDDCVALSATKGWGEIVEDKDNDKSATKGIRDDYQRLLTDIQAGKIRAVVVWDLDRLQTFPLADVPLPADRRSAPNG